MKKKSKSKSSPVFYIKEVIDIQETPGNLQCYIAPASEMSNADYEKSSDMYVDFSKVNVKYAQPRDKIKLCLHTKTGDIFVFCQKSSTKYRIEFENPRCCFTLPSEEFKLSELVNFIDTKNSKDSYLFFTDILSELKSNYESNNVNMLKNAANVFGSLVYSAIVYNGNIYNEKYISVVVSSFYSSLVFEIMRYMYSLVYLESKGVNIEDDSALSIIGNKESITDLIASKPRAELRTPLVDNFVSQFFEAMKELGTRKINGNLIETLEQFGKCSDTIIKNFVARATTDIDCDQINFSMRKGSILYTVGNDEYNMRSTGVSASDYFIHLIYRREVGTTEFDCIGVGKADQLLLNTGYTNTEVLNVFSKKSFSLQSRKIEDALKQDNTCNVNGNHAVSLSVCKSVIGIEKIKSSANELRLRSAIGLILISVFNSIQKEYNTRMLIYNHSVIIKLPYLGYQDDELYLYTDEVCAFSDLKKSSVNIVTEDELLKIFRFRTVPNLNPYKVYNSVSDLVLDNTQKIYITENCMQHCLERRSRVFSDLYKFKDSDIIRAINFSIDYCNKMIKRNPFYALPIYHATSNSITFALPVFSPAYVETARLEVVGSMVVSISQYGYCVRTVYNLETVRNLHMPISIECNLSWL